MEVREQIQEDCNMILISIEEYEEYQKLKKHFNKDKQSKNEIPFDLGRRAKVAILECCHRPCATVAVIYRDVYQNDNIFEVSSAIPPVSMPFDEFWGKPLPYTVKEDDYFLQVRNATIETIVEKTVNGSPGIKGIEVSLLGEEGYISASSDGDIWIKTPERKTHYVENEKSVEFFM